MYVAKWLDQYSDIGCPSLWKGETECGRMIYIRWRWDYLYVFIANKSFQYYEDNPYESLLGDGEYIFRTIYDMADGLPWLSTEVLEDLIKEVLII